MNERLFEGEKRKEGVYARMDGDLFEGWVSTCSTFIQWLLIVCRSTVQVTDKGGRRVLVFIPELKSMDETERAFIHAVLSLLFAKDWVKGDSRGWRYDYDTYHFVYWNRYGASVSVICPGTERSAR